MIPFRAGNDGKVDGDSNIVGFDAVGFQYFGESCPRGAFKCFVVNEYLHNLIILQFLKFIRGFYKNGI